MSAYAVAAGFAVAGAVSLCLTLLSISRRLHEIERKFCEIERKFRAAGEEDAQP